MRSQGNPDEIRDYGSFKRWSYERSTLTIKNNKVIAWENKEGNLLISKKYQIFYCILPAC